MLWRFPGGFISGCFLSGGFLSGARPAEELVFVVFLIITTFSIMNVRLLGLRRVLRAFERKLRAWEGQADRRAGATHGPRPG